MILFLRTLANKSVNNHRKFKKREPTLAGYRGTSCRSFGGNFVRGHLAKCRAIEKTLSPYLVISNVASKRNVGLEGKVKIVNKHKL